jgi:threonine/homoserine/homoserine lactone efflux protein
MDHLETILLPWFVGFLSGFLVSIPIGPVNVTIINEGARRGFKWALLIGLGAVTMEVIYCTFSFAGFATFFDSKLIKAAMELLSFMLMVFLGCKFLFQHSVPGESKSAERVEERLHPHSAFTIGFVRVLGNPGVLLLWITLAGAFSSHDWVEDTWGSRLLCIAGIAMGAVAWFTLLSYLISLKHKQFSTQTLIRMSQFSGVFLLGIGFFIGTRIVIMLYKHQAALRQLGER